MEKPGSQVSIEDAARARPKHSAGAPSRCASHKSAILALLRERGPQGVLGSELYEHPGLYGRSPRNRVSELRKTGHLIEGKPHGSADLFYCLIRDHAGVKTLAESLDWYEREHGARPPTKTFASCDLPLFAGTVRQ